VLNISRIIRVIFSKEAEQEYQKLVDSVKKEHEKSIKNSENQQLLRSVDEKVERLKYAPDSGTQIPKKKFPSKYLSKYEINNLWKMNLFNYWRLIYTLRGDRVEVLCIVLDLINHPDYDKIFRYRKK
jgi:mRNA-degrading endonuclease RelE of RelBE toxin-antitoxin system